MFKEFKEFAMRGNVVDMAVGIIIESSNWLGAGETSTRGSQAGLGGCVDTALQLVPLVVV